ncbi:MULTISPECIES: PilN domain-containing protein [unclassified Arsukibacterium]|uniref:PilN domain-containing protein n=1 Tax=unclassified Arsukibacterium TaxID=2635278 RepID=UPI000C3B505D|nr:MULTISPECIES: PilN domain-containing protein [unclassified Arsukibacterium]MAA96000.1 pilus assembly protein PilN [Rheinheimera sp.]MBM34295.1 pilus assembly protein PilN [Rheinheimera sp.]HAW92317.1 pilus assembly protein PilN [Candidatus Azambacteria bacterium]|tara:strand:+ start:468 stop:1064 length:597 start_codon:yes stop_codon:yes gene_type:complete
MAYINLLPWREAARKEKQKQYVTILAMTAVMSFLLFFLINMVYSSMIDGQYQRNRYLENEIKVLDQKIAEIRTLNETKRSLQQRMSLIEQLQGSRNLGTEIMSEIARVVPSGIYLTQLEKKGSNLLLIGRSESNNRLSTMLRDAEQSELLDSPLLEFIEAGKDESRLLSNFKMHLTVKGYEAVQDNEPVTPSARGGAR